MTADWQLETERNAKTTTGLVENPWTLFGGCSPCRFRKRGLRSVVLTAGKRSDFFLAEFLYADLGLRPGRHESLWTFKLTGNHLVRDAGVAGSNPATPTKNLLSTQHFVNLLENCLAPPGQLSGQKCPRSALVSS